MLENISETVNVSIIIRIHTEIPGNLFFKIRFKLLLKRKNKDFLDNKTITYEIKTKINRAE